MVTRIVTGKGTFLRAEHGTHGGVQVQCHHRNRRTKTAHAVLRSKVGQRTKFRLLEACNAIIDGINARDMPTRQHDEQSISGKVLKFEDSFHADKQSTKQET